MLGYLNINDKNYNAILDLFSFSFNINKSKAKPYFDILSKLDEDLEAGNIIKLSEHLDPDFNYVLEEYTNELGEDAFKDAFCI